MKGTMYVIPANADRPEVRKVFDVAVVLDDIKGGIGGGLIETVPGFDTISIDGVPKACVAFVDEEGKIKSDPLPLNRAATNLWEAALNASGRTLRTGPQGKDASDVLVGDVVVLTGDEEFMSSI